MWLAASVVLLVLGATVLVHPQGVSTDAALAVAVAMTALGSARQSSLSYRQGRISTAYFGWAAAAFAAVAAAALFWRVFPA